MSLRQNRRPSIVTPFLFALVATVFLLQPARASVVDSGPPAADQTGVRFGETEAPATAEGSSPVTDNPSPVAANPEADEDAREDGFFDPLIKTRTPGTDTNLCMSWEVDMTSDPNRRQRLAYIQGSTLGVSTDGGDSFTNVNVGSFLPPTHTSNGDGTASYDANGRLFVAILGNPVGGGGWDVFVSRHDPVDGSLISGPTNVTAQVGIITGMTADKPWIAADSNSTSEFSNRLYVVWSVTGGAFSGDFEIWGAVSTNQGQTWTQMTRNAVAYGPISPLDSSDGRCWPPHVAVAVNGDVYVSYHGQPGFITVPGVSGGTPDGESGLVVVLRSTDGGLTLPQRSEPFPAGEADTTWNSQSRPGAISDARFWTIGTGQGWLLPDPGDPCTLHVVTTDDPNDDPLTGDAADVVMATSTDCGVSWTAPQTVSDGPSGTWQLLPTAAIDPITGSIAVTWLDNRNALSYPPGSAGNARADLRARYSFSGGASWFASVVVNDAPIDPDASTSTIGAGVPPTYRIGEYNGVTFSECTAHMVWAGDPLCGGAMDTYYDRDPETGDLTEPEIFCPDDLTLGCNDSTDPDDTGRATARDTCDADPTVIFVDEALGGSCPPTPVIDNIQRIWSTRDAAGNFASCSQLISIQDFDAPVISAPPPLVLECSSLGGVPSADPTVQVWLDSASAVDECSEAELSISGVPPLFPVGCDGDPSLVVFSAIDECGNSGFEVSQVTVLDTVKPSLATPVPTTFECTTGGGTPIDDPEVAAWLATATTSDACSVPNVTHNAPPLLPAGCDPGAATLVTLTSTDACGNSTGASSTATVVDSTAPDVVVDPGFVVLGPPDHEYRCFDGVRASAGVADACDNSPVDVVIACTSSQCDDAPCPEYPGQDGDGSTVNDCTYDPDIDQLCARAERAETNPEGRLYTVDLTATDHCGNADTTVILELFVPHGCTEGDTYCIFSDGFESGDAASWSSGSS